MRLEWNVIFSLIDGLAMLPCCVPQACCEGVVQPHPISPQLVVPGVYLSLSYLGLAQCHASGTVRLNVPSLIQTELDYTLLVIVNVV